MTHPARQRTTAQYSAIIGLVLTAVVALSACMNGNDETAADPQAEQRSVSVAVMKLSSESVEVESDYAGRVRGSREVEVRARVEGILEERLYQEGQRVEKGDPLFRIDPEPFEIALRGARAERDDAAANLELANREWQRISRLFEQDAVSQRQRDEAEINRDLARARLAIREAAVADAQRNLRYTEVVAPVTGATDLETVPEGSLIDRNALLTRVTQHDPVHIRFSLPENDAAVQRVARRAMSGTGEHEYSARVRLPDGSWYDERGTVDFTDSTIDARTGSVQSRAVVPNADGGLIPGQFVRVRLILQRLEDVYLIPAEAVGEGPNGPTVFLVDGDDKARQVDIELGSLIDGRQLVLSGLSDGDRLVVDGQVALSDGAPVQVREAD
ncbi:efflux RND transporter periplasmic adaptor subunit [Methylonatrum kenyense]|uniref:efflux RND transporter periplasmic adaptor subunit n=1 Tax=Methylonatrum kenyense TaxID=455253 RepID=UPI0020C13189|nr:efflux RND transporter periplasmic adaptor subunit [Methylonatrum kenyense]MCK8516508.1 efflux RND transporter periplasmic adaptor subunit [Methylonatrum kenyense]